MMTKYLDIWLLYLIQKKIIMSLKNWDAFNNNIEYESIGDKEKKLAIR